MKNFILSVVFVCIAGNTLACDACGCSAGGMGFGYIPLQKNHFVGLSYQYNSFETTHPALFENENDELSLDKFRTVIAWGRFYINDRLLVSGFVPFKVNSVVSPTSDYRVNGLGDVRLQAMYTLIQRGNSMSVKQFRWLSGGSLNLPTGKQDENTSTVLPNLQPGTGGYGFEINNQITWRRYNIGVTTEVNLLANTANTNDYRFGNEVASNTVVFYRIKRERISVIPQLGIAQLHRAKDLTYASTETVNALSGIQLISAIAGLSVYTQRFGVRMYAQQPMHHSLSDGYTKPIHLANLQLLYLLTSKK
ncbi:MAG: hypothetical protein JJ975_01620 [Bacteroidia bacterium]|nr:hypothetical protein [Bacteroidia bacterium]